MLYDLPEFNNLKHQDHKVGEEKLQLDTKLGNS